MLLEDYLTRYGAPQDLVIDVTFLDREAPSLVQDFRLYSPYSTGIDTLVKQAGTSIYHGTKLMHLTRYGGEVAQRMLYYRQRSDEDWLLDRSISENMVAAADSLAPYRIGISDSRIRDFQRTLAKFQSAGTNVHLVIVPYYPPFARSITNLDSLDNRVEELTGIPVRNFATVIHQDEYFGDYQHLNKAGAEVFLEMLVQKCKLLPR